MDIVKNSYFQYNPGSRSLNAPIFFSEMCDEIYAFSSHTQVIIRTYIKYQHPSLYNTLHEILPLFARETI